jgi:hypothetical protein
VINWTIRMTQDGRKKFKILLIDAEEDLLEDINY